MLNFLRTPEPKSRLFKKSQCPGAASARSQLVPDILAGPCCIPPTRPASRHAPVVPPMRRLYRRTRASRPSPKRVIISYIDRGVLAPSFVARAYPSMESLLMHLRKSLIASLLYIHTIFVDTRAQNARLKAATPLWDPPSRLADACSAASSSLPHGCMA